MPSICYDTGVQTPVQWLPDAIHETKSFTNPCIVFDNATDEVLFGLNRCFVHQTLQMSPEVEILGRYIMGPWRPCDGATFQISSLYNSLTKHFRPIRYWAKCVYFNGSNLMLKFVRKSTRHPIYIYIYISPVRYLVCDAHLVHGIPVPYCPC